MSHLLSVLHAMHSFLLQYFQLHCSASSSPNVSAHLFMYFIYFLLYAFMSHPQVVNDEDLAEQEYEDDFEVIQPCNYEVGHIL